jgi:hypothetical protein
MTQSQQIMVERLSDLERTVAQLTGRIGELQREMQQASVPQRRGHGGSCLRALFRGMGFGGKSRRPIRENRRVQHHEHCLF